MARRNNLRAEVMKVLEDHPNTYLSAKEIANKMIPPATAKQVYKSIYDMPLREKLQCLDIQYSHNLFAPNKYKIK